MPFQIPTNLHRSVIPYFKKDSLYLSMVDSVPNYRVNFQYQKTFMLDVVVNECFKFCHKVEIKAVTNLNRA